MLRSSSLPSLGSMSGPSPSQGTTSTVKFSMLRTWHSSTTSAEAGDAKARTAAIVADPMATKVSSVFFIVFLSWVDVVCMYPICEFLYERESVLDP